MSIIPTFPDDLNKIKLHPKKILYLFITLTPKHPFYSFPVQTICTLPFPSAIVRLSKFTLKESLVKVEM